MDEPKSLDSLFKEKIFRIPDYQRGFAWKKEHLKDFWEDLVNLSGDRSHYTGVLTLKQIPDHQIHQGDKEFWLVDDHSYHVFHIVDGQQRLTTFIIFLKSFVEFFEGLPENINKSAEEIFITESMNVSTLQDRFLFRTKPTGDHFRTYLFGYESDNPSYSYLRYMILGEEGGGSVNETFYTLNLSNAKTYFTEQLQELYANEGLLEIQEIYKKIIKKFLFNEYIIKDEFDVFVAFETMNNRGKKLSDLELLKNRLIYLTTLYNEKELDIAERKSLREIINDSWKEVYYQLGRNKLHPLNDDEFLRAHWIMYFKYSRKTGQDYIRFLLDEQFSPKKVHKKVEKEVALEIPEETSFPEGVDDLEDENGHEVEDLEVVVTAQLDPNEIKKFAISLEESAIYWFNSYYPELASNYSINEQQWIGRLNRIGIGYFRPLVMSILKNVSEEKDRIKIYKEIERFIFIDFRLNFTMANHGSSEFYNAARSLDRNDVNIQEIINQLHERLKYSFTEEGTYQDRFLYNYLFKKFTNGSGYYGWSSLRYFLYEYETSLLNNSRQKKIEWSDLLKTETDKISIEHIYPQTESKYWKGIFNEIPKGMRKNYCASLGNLLLLSMAINSALQNDNFQDKKNIRYDTAKNKIRNGYSDGSHSEIEVSQNNTWGPKEIRERGIRLLSFMEKRWNIKFNSAADKEKMLFLMSDSLKSK